MISNPYYEYRKNQVETSDPRKLVLMLYDGALKFLQKSRACLQEKDWEKVNSYLGRAQDIISELMGSLDLEAGEVAENLFRLYEFMHHRLVKANVEKSLAYIEEVERLLSSLRQTWKEALKSQELPGEEAKRSRVNFSG